MAQLSIVKKSELEGAMRLDAEYYQPKYLRIVKAFQALRAVPLSEVAKPVKRRFAPTDRPFNYIEIAEVDIGTGAINAVEVAGAEAPSRAQWIVREGDVIVSTVRPARNAVALIGSSEDGFVCSNGFAVLRPIKTSSEFLFAYLKTSIVASLLDRKTTATMYPAVSGDDVLSLPVALLDSEIRGSISDKVKESRQKLKDSESLYLQAERFLLNEIGFKDLDLSHQLYYTVSYKRVREADRLDAEHFQPKYERLEKHLSQYKNGAKVLGSLICPITNGYDCREFESVGVPYLRVGDVRVGWIDTSSAERISPHFIKKDVALSPGDVLFTRKGTYGVASRVRQGEENCIISSEIMRIRLLPGSQLSPDFLAVFLNTMAARIQVEKYVHGFSNFSITQADIQKLIVPLPAGPFQERVADLVTQSWQARQKARQLLEEAKRRVENIVQGKAS